jgi:hypothetical protein
MATSWQPIETAPKDGSEVDLWVVTFLDGVALIGGRVTDAWWLEAFGWTRRPLENGDPSHLEEAWQTPVVPGSQYETRVTHWHPIPDAPE